MEHPPTGKKKENSSPNIKLPYDKNPRLNTPPRRPSLRARQLKRTVRRARHDLLPLTPGPPRLTVEQFQDKHLIRPLLTDPIPPILLVRARQVRHHVRDLVLRQQARAVLVREADGHVILLAPARAAVAVAVREERGRVQHR